MGVKGDNVLLAGVNEGTESPKNVAKRRSHALRLVWTYNASSRENLKFTIAVSLTGYIKYEYGTPSVSLCGIIPQGGFVCTAYKGTLSRAERPLTEAVPSVSYADISPPRGESPLSKQSTGLF